MLSTCSKSLFGVNRGLIILNISHSLALKCSGPSWQSYTYVCIYVLMNIYIDINMNIAGPRMCIQVDYYGSNFSVFENVNRCLFTPNKKQHNREVSKRHIITRLAARTCSYHINHFDNSTGWFFWHVDSFHDSYSASNFRFSYLCVVGNFKSQRCDKPGVSLRNKIYVEVYVSQKVFWNGSWLADGCIASPSNAIFDNSFDQ